ncbi:DEAD/DEAH box helicase [Oscillatoria laete-virens NRMC-F 0139]|nr:DEAD/DEAH box helicase [Oscillatoria laete-virens]MDL5053586.1 DEAD/DEAH box helicase [Oscillatoria laete-virens NRMC-F 0139]
MPEIKSFDGLQNLFLPDPWQVETVDALKSGRDVVLSAPTGAGKTWCFEKYYQTRPMAAVYTVPTRALANDKFAEWRGKGWRVGIITGDISFHEDAPLIVATLEAVQEISLRRPDIRLFVVDEYQWLSDPARGSHYEGVLMTLPLRVQLLLMSGSVSNPAQIARWLGRLGRDCRVVEHLKRPVPIEEIWIDEMARKMPKSVVGHWPRRIAAALRENLGPVLVFAPHRAEAEKLARQIAAALPPPPWKIDIAPEEGTLLPPPLRKLLGAGVAYHHSGLNYAQRARVIEPLAKAGKLRVVIATLGLSAGINFSLRSVLITSRFYKVGGIEQALEPAEILQMSGRAGRRGLDEIGYYLATNDSPSLLESRAAKCSRAAALPWSHLLRCVQPGESIEPHVAGFAAKLFTETPIALGNESTARIDWRKLPCHLPTDTARARLVRRKYRRFKGCKTCVERANCSAMSPAPTLLWQWQKCKLLDQELRLTPRGQIASFFLGPEGLALAAAIECDDYSPEEILMDAIDLFGGERFCGMESRWAGQLALVCQNVYGNFTIDGFLLHGVPSQYGFGARDVIEKILDEGQRRSRLVTETAGVGDIDRLMTEWRSLLRQIAHSPPAQLARWDDLRRAAQEKLRTLPELQPVWFL